MTYAQGGLIQASDFNGFATDINAVWNTIYGQTAVAAVAQGEVITAAQWNAIYNSSSNAGRHQGATITAIPTAGVGDPITYYSQLPVNINAIEISPYNSSAVGADIVATATRTTPWGTSTAFPLVASTITVTFDTVQKANYFFNCGGAVLLNMSRTGGTGTADDASWTQLCSDVGTLGLPALNTPQIIAGSSYIGLTKFGGVGNLSIFLRNGYYQLTTTPTEWFSQYSSSGVYTSDNISISFSQTGAVITIAIVFVDGTSGTGLIDGNLTVTAIARPPETTYITNTWGTPVVAVTAPA